MKTKLFRLVLFMLFLGGVVPASAAFKDIKLDLTNGNFLTTDEMPSSNQPTLSFGVAIGEDGTQTRVSANDATANIVLNGKFHSEDHGWGNFSATVTVEGPVKISMGTCAWGGDVTIKDATGATVGTFNTNTGACYHNDKTNNIVSAFYKGTEATTLTISGGNYTPYFAVEATDLSEVPNDITITYSLGNAQAEGTVPAKETVEAGTSYTIPSNYTLYADGKTLTGWTDGTNTYKPGENITAGSKNMELTPVFTDNTVSLADRTEAVTLNFDFQRKNGAPTVGFQNVTGIWVTQAVVNGETIDVKLNFDTNNGGKIANANWTDWCQMNNGTKLTVPSCKGAVVSTEAYSIPTTTTIDGQTDYTSNGNVITYTIANTAETIDVVIGDGSYYRYINVVLPVVQSAGGKTFTDEPVTVTWAMTDNKNPSAYTVSLDGVISTVAFDQGTSTITGTSNITNENAEKVTTGIKFKPEAGASDILTWSLKPAAGLTFTPKKLTGYVNRCGTNTANGITVSVRLGNGDIQTLGTWTALRSGQASDKQDYDATAIYQYNIELTPEQQILLTGADYFYLTSTIGVNNAKEGAFGEVTISGTVSGTTADIKKYNVIVKATPEEGGTVSVYPKSDEYEEESEIQLTATQNFGYHFVNWTDADNNVISEESKFKYTVTDNAELTANFIKVNTYELVYNVEGGANTYMVQPTPAPTVVNGKTMYEEGTVVTLTASNNPILTFMNWSTGETSAETKVTMDGNKDITATYSAIDYIVGWDFYNPGNNGRPADFASTADNESTTLVLRDAEGNTQGWLDKSTVAAGGYESFAGAAVNWKTDGLGKYYYQTNIKARDFQNIKVQANMMYKYNAYTTQILEYSLDNEKWNEVTRITMENRAAVSPIIGTLPAEANHAENIYIRWRPDTNGNIDGTESNNDGTVIADIYITADADIYDDGTAPVLKSSVPENGATGASASGKIVLNFDEKVKLCDNAKATLNGEELELAVSGMTVTATYKNLEYSTEYEFNLTGNSVSDLAGNTKTEPITINFTTMTRPTVAKGLYDKEVTTADEFLDALSTANSRADKSTRYRIFMHNGTYDLGSAALTAISANNISIIGESEEGVVIKNTPKEEGIGVTATLFNSSTNLYMQDITLKNDYDYNGSTGRAVCLQDKGNKTIAKRVKLLSYQDTYYSNNSSSRYYWEDSEIHGTVDFLCGGGDVYYNRVNLVVENRSGNVIAAPNGQLKYGYVFLDCEINCPEGAESIVNGSYRLGRPWGANARAQYINTKMNVIPAADGWAEMGGNKPEVFAEYNSTNKNGLPVDLSSRKIKFDGGTQASAVLSEAQVAELSVINVMGGNDEWNPMTYTEQTSAPTNVTIEGSTLTWDDSNYVLLYAVCKNGNVIDFTTEPTYTVDDTTAKWSVRAANEMGGLGEAAEAVETSGINDISTETGDVVSTAYYNLQGIRVSKDFNGAVIKVDTMKDGKQISTKIVK